MFGNFCVSDAGVRIIAGRNTEAMFLELDTWRARESAENALVAPFIDAHRARRRRGQKHPVWDFLFDYYPFRPALLSRFSPGIGVELEDAAKFFTRAEWTRTERGAVLDAARFPRHYSNEVHDIVLLLETTQNRAPRHDCFGWHEWAMVYRAPSTRHDLPLRLSSRAIEELLETQTLRCSHFDAVRFWTPEALPLNTLSPTPKSRVAWEQPGCVHTNMDLYRFAARFAPWIASSLVIDAFLLAKNARELDMRASPYDLSDFGFEPVRLELPEGRRQYAALQRDVAACAAPVRARLTEAYRGLIEAVNGSEG